MSSRRRPGAWLLAGALAAAVGVAAAQVGPAPTGPSAVTVAPVLPPPTPREDAWSARSLVALFLDACVAHEGASQPVVDWAVTEGFVPIDAEDPGARALLDDRPGTVLSPPGLEGRVVLAVVDKVHCIVWTDRAGGPSVRLALTQALADRRARGDRLEADLDRKVERAGAWRQQTQWRWRRAGGEGEHRIGLVHTLSDVPAAQVMRLAPAPATEPALPSGVTGSMAVRVDR